MKINKKWLLLGGSTLVIAALGLAVALNQGGLFKGSVINMNNTNLLPPDYTKELADSQQILDTQIMTVTGTDNVVYNILGDKDTIDAGVYYKELLTGNLVFDLEKAKTSRRPGPYYFKLAEAPSLAPAAGQTRQAANHEQATKTSGESDLDFPAQTFPDAQAQAEAAPISKDYTPPVASPVPDEAADPAQNPVAITDPAAAPDQTQSSPVVDSPAITPEVLPVDNTQNNSLPAYVAPLEAAPAEVSSPAPAIAPVLSAPLALPLTRTKPAASLINLAHAADGLPPIKISGYLNPSAPLDGNNVFIIDPAALQPGNYQVNVKNALDDVVLVPIKVVGGQLSKPIPVKPSTVSSTFANSPASQPYTAGTKTPEVLGIQFRNVTGEVKTVTDLTFTGYVSTNGGKDYSPAMKDGVSLQNIISDYMTKGDKLNNDVSSNSISEKMDPKSGDVVFSGLHYALPVGQSSIVLSGQEINPKFLNPTDIMFTYVLKSAKFAEAGTSLQNNADKYTNPPEVFMTIKANDKKLALPPLPIKCTDIDHFAFSPTPLIYDENAQVSPQRTQLYAADAQGKDLGGMLIDNGGCGSDFEKAGLIYADSNFTPALHLELKDENGNLMASDTIMINTPHDPNDPPEIFKALEGYVSFERVTPDLKLPNNKYIRFTTNVSKKDFTIPAKKSLEYNKTYSLSIYGTRPIIVPPKVPADVAAKDRPAASYQIKLIPKKGMVLPKIIIPPKDAADKPADKPTGGNTYNTYNTYNTTNTTGGSTQPSATPCLVNGKTFYLAGGPDSGYCKDLQNAGVMQVDQPAETGNVRYVNALTAMRVANDLGAKLRTRNLSSTWTDKFTDNFSRKASSTELKDFKTVVAASVLTGRIDPTDHSTVTLDPLDEVNVIECLSTYLHTIENSVGVPVDYNPNNVPADILREYHNNPDWKWIAEAYSFGVEYKMITKNQYNAESIFDFTSRGDLANMIARLKGAVKADPSLIKK